MNTNSFDLYSKAREAMDRGALEEAVALFESSVSADPHFKTLELLGECLFKLGRLQESIVPLAAATTLNKGVRAPALLAQVFLDLDDFQDAYDLAELALSRHPGNQLALRVRAITEPHLHPSADLP